MATDMSADAHQTHQDGQGTASPAAVQASHRPRVFETWKRLGGMVECFEEVACSVCGQEWGDAATGGCEAVLLAKRVIELEERLAKWDRWANPPFVPGAAWPVGEE